jgi:hypothetical protein
MQGVIAVCSKLARDLGFLCPRHVMAGAYSVTLFRHSVLPSFSPSVILSFCHHQFPFIILRTVAHIQLKFDIWICHEKIQVKFEFGHGSMILAELCPFYFENNMKFSVSVYYLPNSITHSTQI